ncbi:amine oxidase [Chryseobacterium takakiae]|uniref:Beta-glucosidase/6-phospho-beta-glucosidase/beta-galactosidase n=1 Tax=Chryseobacterium takakiae TaxID=1302685 RepID=A0A1M4TTQ4_9FLAO|nr:amine oxidase [Chryseobacterium takakiae]SHE47832.1 Beta-glucosidase/6-phospho-beta-glucosidase/beta-galactosidase [Chryseobacterium takakiae]
MIDNKSILGNPFHSFIMGGFECADHQNAFGERIDLIVLTGHDRMINEDYKQLREINITTVREGIRWSYVEKEPFAYDWSQVEEIIIHAHKHDIQVIWDICHFGFPDDLTPLHPMFARRFAHLCRAFVKKYRSLVPDGALIITPINEVSFLSWLGGEVKGTSPYCINQGWEVKYMLMKAYIEGIEMMKEMDPSVRIMVTEPLVHISSTDPYDADLCFAAQEKHKEQFQVLDILTGKICPELRGKEEYLDIIGVNFYFNNQWTINEHQFISWDCDPPDPMWRSLSSLVEEMYLQYERPIVISETSIPEHKRYPWLKMIDKECIKIIKKGIPLYGCCIYPIIDRPDWDFPEIWHHSGLWDIPEPENLHRQIHQESLIALNEFRFNLSTILLPEEIAITDEI